MKTLLFIDTDTDREKLVQQTLEKSDYTVIEAPSMELASSLVLNNHPDAVIYRTSEVYDEEKQAALKSLIETISGVRPYLLVISQISQYSGYAFDITQTGQYLPVDEFIDNASTCETLVNKILKVLNP